MTYGARSMRLALEREVFNSTRTHTHNNSTEERHMVEFKASAPTKVIVVGEHAVVYGSLAMAAPLNNRKRASVKVSEGAEIIVYDTVGSGRVTAALLVEEYDGKFDAKAKLIIHVLGKIGGLAKKVEIEFEKNRIPKGTGGSAATAAVLALCVYEALGRKPSRSDLLEAINVMEEVAHGGKASGIDATAVLSDTGIKFSKHFKADGSSEFDYKPVALKLPTGTVLLVVDTLKEGEMPETTSHLVTRFAIASNILKKPGELIEYERQEIIAPYNEIAVHMEEEFHEFGNPRSLGELMNKNQELLRRGNVSDAKIEEGIKISLENGAFGAKVTGAGGSGGAFIVLAEEEKSKKVVEALEAAGFTPMRTEFSSKGASLE